MRRTLLLCVLFAIIFVLFTSTVYSIPEDQEDEAQVMASELAYLQQAFVQTHNTVAEEVDTLFWQELGQKFRKFGQNIKARFQSIFKPKTPANKQAVGASNSTTSAQVPQWLKSTKLPAYVHDAIVRLRNLHSKVKSFEDLKNTHKPIPEQEIKTGLAELVNNVDSKDKKTRKNAIKKIIRAAKKAHQHKAVKQLHQLQIKIFRLKDKLEDLKTKKQQDGNNAATPTTNAPATPAPAAPETATVTAPATDAASAKTAPATPAPATPATPSSTDKINELKQKIRAKKLDRTEKLKQLVELLKQEGAKQKKEKKAKKSKKPKKDNKKRGRKPRVFVAKQKKQDKKAKNAKKDKKNKKETKKRGIKNAFKRLFQKIKAHYKKVGVKENKRNQARAEEMKGKTAKTEEKKPAEVKPVEKKPEEKAEKKVEAKAEQKVEAIKKDANAKPAKKKANKKIPSKSEVAEAIQRLIDRVETLRNQGSAKYFSLVVKLKKVNRLVQSSKPDTDRLNTFLNNLIRKSGAVHPKIPEVIKKLRVVINASLTAPQQAPQQPEPATPVNTNAPKSG